MPLLPLLLLPVLLLPVLPLSDPLPRMEPQADSPSASVSKPTRIALCRFFIMINSFLWNR
jgi:hypothetical protein